MKQIETLVEDIYDLFDPDKHHEPSEENIQSFAEAVVGIVRTRLSARQAASSGLRFSNLGRPDRQIWYQAKGFQGETFLPKTYLKFMYGDIIEAFVLFLCKESGHEVKDEQLEIEVDGIKGHIDAIIDGHVVDVKSASPFSYQKFKQGTLFEKDAFAYIPQISGYANVLTPDKTSYFLAFDKVSGDMCTLGVSPSIAADHKPAPRIAHLRDVIASDVVPPRCYPDVEDGKGGNRRLGTECSYCSYKEGCWPNLRTFLYSNGPRFLTRVEKVPDVFEVRNRIDTSGEEA